MGSESGGNNFPGVARPFGMVKLGPDLYDAKSDAYSGYLSTGNFSGFSMMHEQGTGGAPKYGTVSQLPIVGKTIKDPLSNLTVERDGDDEAELGYYKAKTGEGVSVELGASGRAGIYRYGFPEGSQGNNVLVDVSHVLPSFRGQGLGQNYKGGNITVFADGHYEGSGVYDNGWNVSPDWTIYFCACFTSAICACWLTDQVVTSIQRLPATRPMLEQMRMAAPSNPAEPHRQNLRLNASVLCSLSRSQR